MSSSDKSHETSGTDVELTRRRFATGVAGAAAAGAVGTGSMGSAAAQTTLDFGSDFVPDPRIEAEMTVEAHDRGMKTSPLEYIDNDGELQSLSDDGGRIMERPEEGEPHNPLTLAPIRLDFEDAYAFPRGETYDDGGDEDAPVYALDAEHWEGAATISDGSADTEKSLRVEGDGRASFGMFDPVDSGVRRELQFILHAEAFDGEIEIGVEDDVGNVASVFAGSAYDDADDDVFATDTIPDGGVVVQMELGELNGSLNDLVEVFIDLGPDTTVELTALNIERQSPWDLGTREVANTEDDDVDVETESIEQPFGMFSVTGLDTLGPTFDTATIYDLYVDVAFAASELPPEKYAADFADDDQFPAYDRRGTFIYTLEVPTGYDLSPAVDGLYDEQSTFSDRYAAAEYYMGVGEDPYDPEDYDDDEDDFVSFEQEYADGSPGEDVTITTDIGGGDRIAVRYSMLMTADEASNATGGAIGGGFVSRAGSSLMSIPGAIIAALGGVGIYQWFTDGSGA